MFISAVAKPGVKSLLAGDAEQIELRGNSTWTAQQFPVAPLMTIEQRLRTAPAFSAALRRLTDRDLLDHQRQPFVAELGRLAVPEARSGPSCPPTSFQDQPGQRQPRSVPPIARMPACLRSAPLTPPDTGGASTCYESALGEACSRMSRASATEIVEVSMNSAPAGVAAGQHLVVAGL